MKLGRSLILIIGILIIQTAVMSAESSDTATKQAAQQYKQAAKTLKTQTETYEQMRNNAQFRAEQIKSVNQAGAWIDQMRATGRLSDADYVKAQESLKTSRDFYGTKDGGEVGAAMAQAQEAAKKVTAQTDRCEALKNDQAAYLNCLQNSFAEVNPEKPQS